LGDLETARLYGLRVAEIAARLLSTDPQGNSLGSL